MKKFLALIMLAAMICCSAAAEESAFFNRCCEVLFNIEDALITGFDGRIEPMIETNMFAGVEEIKPDEYYMFASADGSMQSAMVADSAGGDFRYITFATNEAQRLILTLNYAALIPYAAGTAFESEEAEEELYNLSLWCEEIGMDAFDAFDAGESFEAVYSEKDDYFFQVLVNPGENRTVFQASYVFEGYEE